MNSSRFLALQQSRIRSPRERSKRESCRPWQSSAIGLWSGILGLPVTVGPSASGCGIAGGLGLAVAKRRGMKRAKSPRAS